MKPRWKRKGRFLQCWLGKTLVGEIGKMECCTFWYVWLPDDEGEFSDPEGERFRRQWEAKLYLVNDRLASVPTQGEEK